jgi:parallel beta-helix repeat protein
MENAMKTRMICALLVLALVSSFGLAAPAAAATLTVCASGCSYSTIQAAIDAAAPGDTITVAAGTYAGNIIIDKSLTILGDPGDAAPGPGPNAPVIDGGLAPGDGFKLADGVMNVTIAGFEVRNFTSTGAGVGNAVQAWQASTSGITIRDSRFHNLGWNGVLVGNDSPFGGSHTSWTIKGNILETFGAYGFELTNTSNSSIENNIIHASSPADPITCIMILAHRSESAITIKGNIIDGAMPPWLPDFAGYAAIFVAAGDSGTGVIAPANLSGVVIENNTISTTGGRAQVYLANYAGGAITGVHAHGNGFTSFRNSTTAPVDATSNWWGTTNATTIESQIAGSGSALVTYSPWLGAAVGTSPMTWYTNNSIQAAINAAAAGDTVNVLAGTYVEQLVINKNLTLAGTDNPTVRAPASPTGYTIPEGATNVWEPVVLAFGGTADGSFNIAGTGQVTVDISGLTLDGTSRVPSPLARRAVAILYRNVVGGVSHSTVQNMGYSTSGINSWGIMAYGNSDVTFHGNTVSGYAKGGFVVNGYPADVSMPKPHAVIDGNSVTGPPYDPTMTLAPNGIQIGWGATGSVMNNTVTQNGFPGTTWGGTGILIQSSPGVVVEGNTAKNNDYGVAAAGYTGYGGSYATGATIRNNAVESNAQGIRIQDRVVDTLVQNNTITGNEVGIAVSTTSGIRAVGTVINANLIHGNANSGLSVDASVLLPVQAMCNWWGSVKGPKNPANPGGDGDAVSTNASFVPWMLSSDVSGSCREAPAVTSPAADASVNEGQTITANGAFSGSGLTLSANNVVGTFTPNNALGTWTWFYLTTDDVPLAMITVTATDVYARTTTDAFTYQASNVAPTPAIGGAPAGSPEGTAIALTGSATDPSSADTAASFTFSWGVTKNGNPYLTGSGSTFSFTPNDNGTYIVQLSATDKDGGTGSASATINVTNVAPTVGPITAPMDPVQVGFSVNPSASFTDPGTADTHTAVWDWGDASTSAGMVSESKGSGSVVGTHAYASAGIYTVKLIVSDDDGGVAQVVYEFIVVYDPAAGFVTGGGWIMSPAGAYPAAPLLTGKATFGFVAKYHKGATVPSGNTEFQFHAASFRFKSTSYEWLVVAGSKAQFKGDGAVNGVAGYDFTLTAIDGKPDKFRIKISGPNGIVYDNKMGAPDSDEDPTALGGGSIVIHK